MEWIHIFENEQIQMRELVRSIKQVKGKITHSIYMPRINNLNLHDKEVQLFDMDKVGLDALFTRLEAADCIVWHGFLWNRGFVLKLFLKKKILKKSIWHITYGDILYKKYSGHNPIKKMYYNIKEFIKGSMKAYVVDTWEDYYRVKNNYGESKSVFLAGTPFERKLIYELKKWERGSVKEKTVNVLIGNGNYPENQHAKIIELLSKFMYENIKVHIPLYGSGLNGNYAKKVKAFARRIFSHKVVFYEKEMDAKDYVNFLGKIDVAIYFSDINNAVRDILILRYLGKKVYVADKLRKNYQLSDVENGLAHISDLSAIKFPYFVNYIRNDKNISTSLPQVFQPRIVHEKVMKRIETFDHFQGWEEVVRYVRGEKKSETTQIKYLHLIPPRYNLIYPFMELCQKHFFENQHHFQVTTHRLDYAPGLVSQPYTEFEIGKNVWQRTNHIFRKMKAADSVILHSLYLSRWELLRLAFSPAILRKTAWIEWGKDLYNYKKEDKSLKAIIHNYIHTRIRENVSYFVSIFPPDEQVFRKNFKNRAPIFQTSYVAYNSIELLEKTRPKTKRQGVVRVQVAHSCNVWNNHFDILNALAHLKYSRIELVIPLSTGAPIENKKKVSTYAKTLFGHKAKFLWDEMDKEGYFKFLWSVDIAVFWLERQAALGNILRLLYMGKKVFLPKDSVMYDFFVENGVEIYDSKKIPEMTYEEFVAPLKKPTPDPFIVKMMNEQSLVDSWQQIFSALDKK
ncbi:MAG: TDP-N-acetylfucosamine:lipid II N-acetylfucosaminyltransferase [Lachnospiraceae bacterium]